MGPIEVAEVGIDAPHAAWDANNASRFEELPQTNPRQTALLVWAILRRGETSDFV